ncbi:hypothetical protein ACFZDK_35470 [Streptomyces sp. NPDC007901]|uniref:hypothetical protein n=1 Tax=Streptomyces sp. NPDC007901 TaxID=3364785 RepID=UPI0036E8ECDC
MPGHQFLPGRCVHLHHPQLDAGPHPSELGDGAAPVDATTGGTVGDFLDDVPPGAVVVMANDGRTDVTVWGGIMTGVAAIAAPRAPSSTASPETSPPR